MTIALATDSTVKIRSRQRRASTVSIPEIVERLQEQANRAQDYLVPADKLVAQRSAGELRVQIGEHGVARMYDRVLPQLCGMTAIDSVKAPGAFMRQLLTAESEHRDTFIDLAAHNINTLLQARGTTGKQQLVRTLLDDDNQTVIRAVLSDHYLPINSLDMVITALGVVTGKIKSGKVTENDAVGAQAFDWHLDPFRLSVGFVNPTIAFDLKNPERGVFRAEGKTDTHGWTYPGGGNFDMRHGGRDQGKDTHLVFPACFLSNSDTGGGSAVVETALLEAACINTCRTGPATMRRHLGGKLEDVDFDSDTTKRKMREVFLSRIVDGLTQVFDPKRFEQNCKKFLRLSETEVKDVVKLGKEMFDSGLPGGKDMLQDFLKAYEQMTPGRDTLLDVNRALTNIAQDQRYDVQEALESFAGKMVLKGEGAFRELTKATTDE